MNNEFEWRNEMRKLGGPVEPVRDLWPSIAARIVGTPAQMPARPRRRQVGWFAIAATVIVAIGAGTTAYRWQPSAPGRSPSAAEAMDGRERPPGRSPSAAEAMDGRERPPGQSPGSASTAQASDGRERSRTALDWAVPADPQLAATVQNLDSASAQLQDALEQRPDAVFLVGLLNRTNAQRLRLMRKSPYAG
jgi:hypothetical protein